MIVEKQLTIANDHIGIKTLSKKVGKCIRTIPTIKIESFEQQQKILQ